MRVGAAGNVTVFYDAALGPQGASIAQQLLGGVTGPYAALETAFAIRGGNVQVVVSPLSADHSGSAGAYHYGCDFSAGGTLYLDAAFASTTVAPLDLQVALYVAELSECFMGPQNKGWNCGYSHGEALSRLCAEVQTPPGTLDAFATAGIWRQAGFPDWISKTEKTDQNPVSTGCAIVYLYWMLSRKYTLPQIVQAGGATCAQNYQTLTGQTTAYSDLMAALKAATITSDNPFRI